MSWAFVVKSHFKHKTKCIIVKDNISCAFKHKTVKNDNIPRHKEILPHPRDDFIMTNGCKVEDNDAKKVKKQNSNHIVNNKQIPENHWVLSFSPLKMIHHNQSKTLINGYIHIIQLLLTQNIPIEINIIIINFCFIKTDNLKHWFTHCDNIHKPLLLHFCNVNPFHQAIIFCSLLEQATELNQSICADNHSSCLLDAELNEKDDIDPITSYNNGETEYIICHGNSRTNLLNNIDPNKLNIIINYDLVEPIITRSNTSQTYSLCSEYLKRGTIGKYIHKNIKIHIISFIMADLIDTYVNVEEQCKVCLYELPCTLSEALIDLI
eukprot:477207_1